jgi:hypothetical protein
MNPTPQPQPLIPRGGPTFPASGEGEARGGFPMREKV